MIKNYTERINQFGRLEITFTVETPDTPKPVEVTKKTKQLKLNQLIGSKK